MRKQILLFLPILFCLADNASSQGCDENNRQGKFTRYAFEGSKTPDTNSSKGLGHRNNRIRAVGDGIMEIRESGSNEWLEIEHPGSCAVLGEKRNMVKFLGTSNSKKSDRDGTKTNPYLELTLSDKSFYHCCWEDSGTNQIKEKGILRIDLYDPPPDKSKTPPDPPKNLQKFDKIHICDMKIIGDCMNEVWVEPTPTPTAQPTPAATPTPTPRPSPAAQNSI